MVIDFEPQHAHGIRQTGHANHDLQLSSLSHRFADIRTVSSCYASVMVGRVDARASVGHLQESALRYQIQLAIVGAS